MEEEIRKHPKIGIFGHYGNQNLGDEAIIEATIQNLRRLVPNVELVGLSINPEDTQTRYNIDAFPIRYNASFFEQQKSKSTNENSVQVKQASEADSETQNTPIKKTFLPIRIVQGIASRLYNGSYNLIKEITFLRACKKKVSELDLLLICGSNQFLDNFGGPWGFPYTILKWTLLAKSSDTKVAFISVGAGPIYKNLSYRLLAPALRRADYLSYRDIGSKKLIEEHISGINGNIYPDLAHSLLNISTKSKSETQKIIAINPMPVFDSRYWYKSDQNKVDNYINSVAKFSVQLAAKGFQVVLFNTQTRDLDSIEDIMNKVRSIDASCLEKNLITVAKHTILTELLDTLNKSDIIVATRFHATVLPLRLGIPTFGITYYRKAREQLDDIGLTDCYVDIEDFDLKQLSSKFSDFIDNSDQYNLTIVNNFNQYRQQLDEQWKIISELLPHNLSSN